MGPGGWQIISGTSFCTRCSLGSWTSFASGPPSTWHPRDIPGGDANLGKDRDELKAWDLQLC